MIKLYGVALSPYFRKVHLALLEKGLDFEIVPTDSGERVNELHRLSPRGEVPVMTDGDIVITDSTIMLAHLEEQYPEHPLLPADPAGRAKARSLEDIGDRLGDAIVLGFYLPNFLGMPELKDRSVPRATEELADLYQYLETQLGDRDYFCGPDLSLADIGLISTVTSAQFFQHGPEDYPRLTAWLERMMGRESVQRDMAAVMAASSERPDANWNLPQDHPHRPMNMRAERAEFLLRAGCADWLGEKLKSGTIRVGLPLMHTV